METKLTLQEMHERVHALYKEGTVPPMFRLIKSPHGRWRAAWGSAPYATENTMQAAIDLAFSLAVNYYRSMGAVT